MMKLVCGENNLEYTGGGFIQCGRHVKCPKLNNNKVLGFDCILYMDNLPEGCKLDVSEPIGELISEDIGADIGRGEEKDSKYIGKDIGKDNDNLINILTHNDMDNGNSGKGKINRPALRIIPADEQIVV